MWSDGRLGGGEPIGRPVRRWRMHLRHTAGAFLVLAGFVGGCAARAVPVEPPSPGAAAQAAIPSAAHRPCPSTVPDADLLEPPHVTLGRGNAVADGMVGTFQSTGCGAPSLLTTDFWLPDGPRLAGIEPLVLSAPDGVTFARVDATYSAVTADDRTSWGTPAGNRRPLEVRRTAAANRIEIAAPEAGGWAIDVAVDLVDGRSLIHWTGNYVFGLTIIP